MTLFGVSALLTGVTSLGMGVFVYFNGRNKKLNAIWLGVTSGAAIWGFGSLVATQISDYGLSMLWWKFAYVGVILTPVFFFHFICIFLEYNLKMLIRITYLLAAVFAIFNIFFEKLFLGGINFVFESLYWFGPPGIVYNFFYVLFYLLLNLFSYYLLFRKMRTSSGLERTQMLYFIVGSGVGWLGSEGCFPIGWNLNVYPITNFLVVLYPIILGYAIVRHQLMDITVIVKKTLVFAGLFAASFGVFVSFAYLGAAVFENIVNNRWIALIPSVFVIVLILRPLENFLVNATDKFLFQKKYDYRELLRTFSNEVLAVLDLNTLVNITVNKLVEVVKLENAALLLYDKGKEKFRMVSSGGPEATEYILDVGEGFIRDIQKSGRYVLRENPDRKNDLSEDIKQKFDELKAEVLIPLTHRDELVGVLSLGKKKSDEEFTQDDIAILLPLAKTLSIAITNAQLIEELSVAHAQSAQREKMAVIGTLSAGINHEICNPLGIARGQCEMFLLNLKDGIYKNKTHEELIEKAQEIMQKVIHETDRATVITRKLSSFAKPAKGLTEGDVHVGDELNEVVGLVEHDLKLDNIRVISKIAKDTHPISADRKQLQEIFFNIVRNAAQSIEGKGTITVSALNSGSSVYVDIKDDGIGMNKEHMSQIFNPFFTTKEPGQGTGLGLFIVKQIVEKNNGHISVDSEPGKGTVFHLVFDAHKGSKNEEAKNIDDR